MQKEVNRQIDEIANELYDTAARDADLVEGKVDSVRKGVNSLLFEYMNKDGKIPKHRVRTLLRELDALESDIGVEINDALSEVLSDTVDKTNKQLIGALIAVIGVSLIKRPNSDKIAKDISEFMFGRELGGITLGSRIEAVAGVLRDSMQQAIRYGVLTGKSATVISRSVKEAVDKAMWQVRRILVSEIPTAFRKSVALIGDKAGVIVAVRIIDNRGRHRYHETHECYRLAEQDMYGWGKGVYKPTDGFIFDPHPQCSAYFHYILRKDLLKGGDA